MDRKNIVNGGWFDRDSAHKYAEGTYWDGHNHISKATNSQWSHETLYLTKNGRWVLESGTYREEFTLITARAAAEWLLRNGQDENERLTDEVRQIIAEMEQ